jgi:hypothetical protein
LLAILLAGKATKTVRARREKFFRLTIADVAESPAARPDVPLTSKRRLVSPSTKRDHLMLGVVCSLREPPQYASPIDAELH